jgi:hypothetical protein
MSKKLLAKLLVPFALAGLMLVLAWGVLQSEPLQAETIPISPNLHDDSGGKQVAPMQIVTSLKVLVDDFKPQPYQGDSVYYYNRLGGDRGALQDADLEWGEGQVTTTISTGNSWGGVWLSLNHPIREAQPVNFSAALPPQILPAYQSRVTDLTVQVTRGTSGRRFKLELKDGPNLRWSQEAILSGGQQTLSYDLPPLGDITQLVWVLDQAVPGDYVVVKQVLLTATTQITDVAVAAFVWSYGMLLNDWNSETGLVRDKAKDASGEFDAVQSTGSLAAATAMAEQLGVIDQSDAVQIVTQISGTLLTTVPRYHGLWPHFVRVTPSGVFTIVTDTEWSTVDTAIAAIGLLDAQNALDLDSSSTEQMLEAIDWNDLLTPNGLSHGYTYTGELIPYAWDTFGGESWLLALLYAAVTHQVPPITYATPPTANGSGFIDELAWLFVLPPSVEDYWGVDWAAYRQQATYTQTSYYPTHYPASCFAQLDLFGLSAAEVPVPSAITKPQIYQAFGVGGQFSPPNDGSALLGMPVVAPHYSAMVASLRPSETISMWNWLINQGPFSPLNNVESLMFPTGSTCDASDTEWNQLKGSWNLALQTLGWGRYLAQQWGQTPVLWKATIGNTFLRNGYKLLVPNGLSPVYLPVVLKG